MRVDELPDETRLADARLPDHGHDLAVPGLGALQGLPELIQLAVAADEAGQPTGSSGVEPGAHGRCADELVDLHWLREALHRDRSSGGDLDVALGELQHRRGQQDSAGRSQLLHAGRQVRGLTYRRVVHAQIGADGADHHLARVEPDTNLDEDAVRAEDPVGVPLDRLLHPERRVAGPHRVILVRERRAEQRHDAVAHHLVDGALVAMDGLHHPFEHRVEELARLLGIAVGEQLHRALEVGEEHRDLLALAFEGALEVRIFSARCLGV